jgi:colicin import membrane protein
VADEGSKTKAWIGAIIVHVALVAVLVFSVRWKQEPAQVVSADIVMPAPKNTPPPSSESPPPPPPKTTPTPPPPPPAVVKDVSPKVDNAQIKRAEDEKKKEIEKKEKERAAFEEKKRKEEQLLKEQALKKEAEKKQSEQRTKEIAASKERAAKEQRDEKLKQELADKAAREAQERLAAQQAAQQAAERAAKEAAARARTKAEGDWVAKIRSKVKGNTIWPEDDPSNPQAVFEVSLLPTGEVLDVRLVRTSGNTRFDDAVQRGILKSSPLPKPDQADVFQRSIRLQYRLRE